MDQKELREWESRCIQEEPPGCTAACPLGVDARAFVRAMGKGEAQAARLVLEKTMPLAGVTGRMCEAPCEPFCLRYDLGGPIAIGLLERACMSTTTRRSKVLCLPARGKRTAVVGGGPSSLAAAFDLAKKGYEVSLHCAIPGGWLKEVAEQRLPAKILAEELINLTNMGVRFVTVAAITPELLQELRIGCGAVYLGRDDDLGPELAGLAATADNETRALPEVGLFAGGLAEAAHRQRYIESVAQGRVAALSIDRFLQGVSLTADRPLPRRGRTDLFTQTKDITPLPRLFPKDPSLASDFDQEEARQEAERCIDCQCLECVRHCVFLEKFGSYPKVYTRRVYNNEAIVKGTHQANTFINSCSLCGQCQVLCPRDFSMATLCLEARQRMVAENRMPPSAHAFALDEMRAALDSGVELIRHAVGEDRSSAIFYPGCQLAGVRPDQTLALYERLLQLQPQTGIWLGCCGAPGHWSGRKAEFIEIGEAFVRSWKKMGEPLILTCCSSCLLLFQEHLPEIPVDSVWNVLARHTETADLAKNGAALALSDPCTARNDRKIRASVRQLVVSAGREVVELSMTAELTECCGYGGLMENANPNLARKVVERRIAQSPADFLTYCIMCREQFARAGKPTLHLLDLLFPQTAREAQTPPVGISGRRENRRILRQRLQQEYFHEELPQRQAWRAIKLKLLPDLVPILEKRRILEDDIRHVLHQVEESGRFFEHNRQGIRMASARFGETTIWIEYVSDGEGYLVQRCWSHRMKVKGGRHEHEFSPG
jgi:Fe-S oxidoreductase